MSQGNQLPEVQRSGNTLPGEYVWSKPNAFWIKLFLVLGCGLSICLYFVPVLLALPFAIIVWKKINDNRPINIWIKIGTFLFTSMLAGLLLFLTNDQPK